MLNLKHKLFSAAVKNYFKADAASNIFFKRGAFFKNDLICKVYYGLTSCFGCEGDKDAPIAFIDGSFLLRDRGGLLINYGCKVNKLDKKIKWYNKEGWLPCFVSEMTFKDEIHYTVTNFADKLTVDGNDFEAAYSRLEVKNSSCKVHKLYNISRYLTPLDGKTERTVAPGETAVFDFAVWADRFGKKIAYPSADPSVFGGFDEHYDSMKSYWEDRLSSVCNIMRLPDKRLIDAYKAGYVYTLIVKDGNELHVGENGYDRAFDHDSIGIIAALLTMGDFRYFEDYVASVTKNIQYPDAEWKYPWIFALYLMRTGDTSLVMKYYGEIKKHIKNTSNDRVDGIMKRTSAIDTNGLWTTDNWSALTGFWSYHYICDKLGFENEAEWAEKEYISLLDECNKRLDGLLKKYGIDYIPMSMTEPNELGQRCDPRDANWASMFLFGRWAWDCFVLGAKQYGPMLDLIDNTYAHGFERMKNSGDANFGGYPHGIFSSS
ncbi:MAG: S-layer homology domain-containing protein, partial [Clostridiales bacterium]|nr:S-layer homology domain-containing protein [Clostridiales bacterium]